MLIIIKTYQQLISLGTGALQFGRGRKRSLEEAEDIHGNCGTGHHQKGTITLKQPVEKLNIYQAEIHQEG